MYETKCHAIKITIGQYLFKIQKTMFLKRIILFEQQPYKKL